MRTGALAGRPAQEQCRAAQARKRIVVGRQVRVLGAKRLRRALAAGRSTFVEDLDLEAAPRKAVGHRGAGKSCADDEHAPLG